MAYANEHRCWQLYETVFQQLLVKCQHWVVQRGGGKKFRFHNRLLSLDATVVDLCLSLYDWAQFQRTKGAVKLHLLLDQDGYLPSFAVVTNGNTADLKAARQLRWEAGTILVFDRGYTDYEWFIELSRQKVFFVTRLKKTASYEVVEGREAPRNSPVVRDEVIHFPSHAAASRECFFRRVEVEDPDTGERLVFLSNNFDLAALTIAHLYKARWQVGVSSQGHIVSSR